MSNIFRPTFEELLGSGLPVWEPRGFKAYLAQHGLSTNGRKTPEYISVDSREALPSALRSAGVMVLRLGRADTAEGTAGTAFALVRLDGALATCSCPTRTSPPRPRRRPYSRPRPSSTCTRSTCSRNSPSPTSSPTRSPAA